MGREPRGGGTLTTLSAYEFTYLPLYLLTGFAGSL